MDVLVVSDQRLERTPDGVIWGPSAYQFWSRYLEVFDNVRIVARLRDVARPTGQNAEATGPNVTALPVPHYLGPAEYLRVARQVSVAVRRTYTVGDAVIMRIGCHIAGPLHRVIRRLGAPYGVEVIGDPHDVFAPGVLAHPLRPLFRWWFTRQQRAYCAGASAAAYVTQHALQQRYPCGAFAIGVSDVQAQTGRYPDGVLSTHYSSVALDEGSFQVAWPRRRHVHSPCRLVTVGSLEQLYKGTDFLLQAVAACVATGLDLSLTVIGDGRYRASLELSARRLGLADRVTFTGAVRGAHVVKSYLDEADLFVLPSLTEGLPRALIEAMARGLPCLASDVGGIPELLAAEDLFPPAQAVALAAAISSVVVDTDRLERMSARNLLKARDYREPVLRERRVEFYRHLREQTEEWVLRHRSEADIGHRPRMS